MVDQVLTGINLLFLVYSSIHLTIVPCSINSMVHFTPYEKKNVFVLIFFVFGFYVNPFLNLDLWRAIAIDDRKKLTDKKPF